MDTRGSMQVPFPDLPREQRTPAVASVRDRVRLPLDRGHERAETNQPWRAAIARRQAAKPGPTLPPSLRPRAPPPGPPPPPPRRRGQPTRPRRTALPIHRAGRRHPPPRPARATFRGLEPDRVQELRIANDHPRSRRARAAWPAGGAGGTPRPAGGRPVAGGPCDANWVAAVLHQEQHAPGTASLVLEHRGEYGSAIAAGPLHRGRTANQDRLHQEKAAGRAAALPASSDRGTADTGARPPGPHGYGTAIGNDRCAYFQSRARKRRLNFGHVLQGPRGIRSATNRRSPPGSGRNGQRPGVPR